MENNNMSLVFSMDLIEKWSFKKQKHEQSSIELIKKHWIELNIKQQFDILDAVRDFVADIFIISVVHLP